MISNWYYYEISQRNLFSQYVNVYSALFPTRFVCTRNSYKTDSERVYGMTPPRALLYPEMSLYWGMIISHTHTQIGKPSHFINVRTVVRCTKSAAAVTYTCVEVHLIRFTALLLHVCTYISTCIYNCCGSTRVPT